MTRRSFLYGDDFARCQIFGCHTYQWTPIRDKVAAWVKEGWKTWEEEKPDWFTDQWIASVPEDMTPSKVGDVGDSNNMSAEIEREESFRAVGEEQKGRRRSIIELIRGQRVASSKVTPAGVTNREFDEKWFLNEMNRRGSISL